MSHTTSSARRAAAQRLLLETTLFQEETSLPRLQALLTTLEDQPPPAFSAEASWRQLQATHPDCFPLRRARAWRRWALAGSAAALAALVLLLPAQTKESTAPAPALSQDAVSQVIPTSAGLAALYDLAYLENLAPPETNCQGLFHQIHKKSTKKGARSTVWLLTPRLTDYIFPFSRSLQRYA